MVQERAVGGGENRKREDQSGGVWKSLREKWCVLSGGRYHGKWKGRDGFGKWLLNVSAHFFF